MSTRPEDVRRRLETALDRLRPGMLRDGGNMELLAVAGDGTVKLEIQGACATCPAQSTTLQLAVEPALREAVPTLAAIVPVPGDPTPLGD